MKGSSSAGLKIGVTIVGNLSLTSKETVLKISDKWQPDIEEFFNRVKTACDVKDFIPRRIYWRVSNSEFMIVRNYLDLKTALCLMNAPRIYVVLEEPAEDEEGTDFLYQDYPTRIISDVEILRCVTTEEEQFGSAENSYTCEYREVYRMLKVLMKALSLLCVRSSSSGNAAMLEAPPGSREDLVEAARIPCTQPTDLDAMLYGYTNNIYVLDHAQESLPAVSGCYCGSTNQLRIKLLSEYNFRQVKLADLYKIRVKAAKDMDMLQLFASPAGRALVVNEPQPKGTTLTSSLTRDSTLRSKHSRRTSATGTASAPASPPRQRKSSAELYKEAAEILGLTCSMTDSCRCIDCQSNYFDCEEDYGDTRTEVAAGTPILHALSHPLTCTIQ